MYQAPMAVALSTCVASLLLASLQPCCYGVRLTDDVQVQVEPDPLSRIPWTNGTFRNITGGEGARSTGLAFMGGGFMGKASASGFVAGLVHANAQRTGNGTVASAMENVSAIACNSGGCWFSAPLLWSAKFNDLLESMAATPSTAPQQHLAKVANAVKELSAWDPAVHPLEVSCCDRKLNVLPCGLGFFGKPRFIKLNGNGFCCPRGVTPDCKKKGMMPCGEGFFGKSHMVMFGETKYCCPLATSADKFQEGSACLDVPTERSFRGEFINIFTTLGWYLLNSELSYRDIVQRVVEVMGDFNASAPLSTPPLEWAVGKDFYVVTNIIAPAPDSIGPMLWCTNETLRMTLTLNSESSRAIRSWDCHGQFCGTQVPSSFSVTLGSETSPREFTSVAGRDAVGMEYSVRQWSWFQHSEPLHSTNSTGDLEAWGVSWEAPIKDAVAASSAVAAMAAVESKDSWLAAVQRNLPVELLRKVASLGVHMSAADSRMDLANFEENKESVIKCPTPDANRTKEIAARHAMALSDGKTNDDVGIAHLIAEGHSNVLAIYNINLFYPENEACMHSLHQYLSGQPSTVFAGVAAYPIFEENLTEVTRQLGNFVKIPAPSGSAQLDAVWYGELLLTTVESPPFGIEAGRDVTVRLLIHSSSGITCCELQLEPYSVYAGEIVQTYAQSSVLQDVVLGWVR